MFPYDSIWYLYLYGSILYVFIWFYMVPILICFQIICFHMVLYDIYIYICFHIICFHMIPYGSIWYLHTIATMCGETTHYFDLLGHYSDSLNLWSPCLDTLTFEALRLSAYGFWVWVGAAGIWFSPQFQDHSASCFPAADLVPVAWNPSAGTALSLASSLRAVHHLSVQAGTWGKRAAVWCAKFQI